MIADRVPPDDRALFCGNCGKILDGPAGGILRNGKLVCEPCAIRLDDERGPGGCISNRENKARTESIRSLGEKARIPSCFWCGADVSDHDLDQDTDDLWIWPVCLECERAARARAERYAFEAKLEGEQPEGQP